MKNGIALLASYNCEVPSKKKIVKFTYIWLPDTCQKHIGNALSSTP
jgi:hypothetical protein